MLSTLELLRKYDVPGPRYTSYPTVPAWQEHMSLNSHENSLKNIQGDEPLSLYFHLPFCENLCHFCGCYKIITKDHSRSRLYVDTLNQEINLVSQKLVHSQKNVSQIHLGGGTPNFISPQELHDLMQTIRKEFNILPDAEIAIEMHPRTSTEAFCEELKKQGFNRISLGVQSFDDHVQSLINRFQTFEQTHSMMERLRQLGFQSFNFDLIYGLPGDTLEKFQQTLDLSLSLKPDRYAVYSYAHVPWKSKVQRSFRDEDLPSPETKLKMFDLALSTFSNQGLKQVGMDHFSTPNDELYLALTHKKLHRNFMGYSTRKDAHQIGFGLSSISYIAGNYYQNTKDMDEYTQKTQSGSLTSYRGYELTEEDHRRRDIITEIMCHMQIDVASYDSKNNKTFAQHFAKEWVLLKNFERDGLIEIHPEKITVNESGKLVLRNLAMIFDAYLDDVKKNSVNPVFSRTI